MLETWVAAGSCILQIFFVLFLERAEMFERKSWTFFLLLTYGRLMCWNPERNSCWR